jgi:ABC-type transporter Mla MlaB component
MESDPNSQVEQERLGLDLDETALADLHQAIFDRQNQTDGAYIDLSEIDSCDLSPLLDVAVSRKMKKPQINAD